MERPEAGRQAAVDIADWLRLIGLQQYELAFRENDIDAELLPRLTGEDLKDLGITSVGHRRKLLDAIAVLRDGERGAASERDAANLPSGPTPDHGTSAATSVGRRQLTVMFCDLVGSTALASRLDLEDLREVIAGYHRSVAAVVEGFGGFVAKYMGDGVLLYFGYPHPHEDDSERAIRAGLALIDAVAKLQAPERLQARVGIATGPVVVGDLIGSGTAQEQSVVGETPNLAARLQVEAPTGAVVISSATRRLAGEWFAYRDLGSRVIKGVSEPVPIIQVVGERRAESRFAATRAMQLTPFVGREQEIELLLDRWRTAGEGQVVVLSGEAGIGKSRISETVRERIGAESCVRIRYQCSPYHTETALYPAVAQFSAAACIDPQDAPEINLDRLEKLLLPTTSADAAPLFAALLGIPAEPRYGPLNLTPELQKARTLRALADQLFTLARRNAVLFLLEDVQWLDPTTRELLDLVVDPIGRARILLLATARLEFQNPWVGHSHVTTLALTRLGQRHSTAMIGQVTGGRALPEELERTIAARADGVPLFLEELTKSVLESGLLRERDGQLIIDGPLPPLAIPATLRDSLMARLDRISVARQVAQVGAAIGREFDYQLLAEVSHLPETALWEALGELEAAGLVFRRGFPPEESYAFKHALVQDVAYESLLRGQRQHLHSRISAALEQLRSETVAAQPELLARHLTEAGFFERAARQWLHAGQLAMSHSAATEATGQFTRGLGALQGMEPGPLRDAIELDLQIALGGASMAASGYSAAKTEAAYERAVELLSERAEDPREFSVRHGLAAAYMVGGKLAAAERIATEGLRRARKCGTAAALCIAHLVLSKVLGNLVRWAESDRHALEAENLYDPEAHSAAADQSGQETGGAIARWLMVTRAMQNDPVGAEVYCHRAIQLAEHSGHVASLCLSLTWAAFRYLVERDMSGALQAAERMQAIADEHGMTYWAATARFFKGAALATTEAETALSLIQTNAPKMESFRTLFFHSVVWCSGAEALIALGRLREATTALNEAGARAAQCGTDWWAPEVHRVRAALIRAEGGDNWEGRARAELARAVSLAEAQGAEMMRLRAAAELEALCTPVSH